MEKESKEGKERYRVVDGSQSAHCCFDWTVVDTTKPSMIGGKQYVGRNGPEFDSVCECFNRDDADKICAALNGIFDSQKSEAPKMSDTPRTDAAVERVWSGPGMRLGKHPSLGATIRTDEAECEYMVPATLATPIQFTYEDTPALWRCSYDPEGPQGLGKTKDEALFDLWLSCDFEGGEEHLMKAIVAAIEGTKSGGVFESVREQQRGLSHWPDSLHAAWFKWSSTPAYAGFLRDVPIQLRPCALRFVQAAFEEAAKLPPKPNSTEEA